MAGRRRRRQAPLWARLCLVFGVVLATVSGVALTVGGLMLHRVSSAVRQSDLLSADARAVTGSHIRGPLNFLLIGSNWREDNPSNGERADSIMIVHVSRDLSSAYLVSVPRDLQYAIKPWAATNFGGSTEKIDAALNFGGMPLMTETIADLTGLKFNGAIYARFNGFRSAVEALGGVDMCVDEETTSVHIGYDRDGNFASPFTNMGASPLPVYGVTPVTYSVGCRHFTPHQALDFVRQRELLPDGDYGRQRHNQQFITAVLKQTASAGTLTDPLKLDKVIQSIGSALTIDTNGTSPVEFAYALRHIQAESLVGIKAPSHSEMIGDTSYVIADPELPELWEALREDTLDVYAATHTQQLNPLQKALAH